MLISHRQKPKISSSCYCCTQVDLFMYSHRLKQRLQRFLPFLYKRTMDFNRLGCVGYDVPVKLGKDLVYEWVGWNLEMVDLNLDMSWDQLRAKMSRNLQQAPKRKNLQASKLYVQVLSVIDKFCYLAPD
ncbi:hypothetical protein LINPERHAP2_LOCUS30750 [Linum perenne]